MGGGKGSVLDSDYYIYMKIAGKNISNLRYADDTTLMTESEEELKSLLMKVKEESEKVNHFMANRWGNSFPWKLRDFYFLGLQSHCRW